MAIFGILAAKQAFILYVNYSTVIICLLTLVAMAIITAANMWEILSLQINLKKRMKFLFFENSL
jgi:hypothetical protein